MATYAEKLKDPRWQKKRLKVLERDKWTCKECGDKENTLNVHHLKYAKSGNPWDTPIKDLQTLCEKCHEGERGKTKRIKNIIDMLHEFDPTKVWAIWWWCLSIKEDKASYRALISIIEMSHISYNEGKKAK